MTDLRDIPTPSNRAAWPTYMTELESFLAKPRITIEELALGGELYNRLHPVMSGWSHELQRHADDRLRGLASAKSDPELEQLYSRIGGIIGRLREFAAVANAGSPNFPVTVDHERLAAAVAAEAAKQVREASRLADKPKPEWRWTPNGYIKSE